MSNYNTIDFSLLTTEEKVIPAMAADRHDIYVDGEVDIVITINGSDKTIGTVTNTLNNFYCTEGFKVVANGTAVGKVTSVRTAAR